MTPHDFTTDRMSAEEFAAQPWIADVYRKAFPLLEHTTVVRVDGWAQRGGVDRVLHMRNGRSVTVEEKIRWKCYPDFALERWSDEARRKPGWIQQDLLCDYLAYIRVDWRELWLFPFLDLRRAWIRHGRRWAARPKSEVRAPNPGYTTVSVAVPDTELLKALVNGMRLSWTETEEGTLPRHGARQLNLFAAGED